MRISGTGRIVWSWALLVLAAACAPAQVEFDRPEPCPTDSRTLRFAVIGDYGSGRSPAKQIAELVKSWHPDLVATVGDNNYPKGAPETIDKNIGALYHDFIAPYHGDYGEGASVNRFLPIPGHRDWDTDRLRPYLDYFELPGNERYYDFVCGPAHFFMLDTDEREPDGAREGSRQANWLREKLAGSSAPWRFVFAHHAPYTSHNVPDVVRMRWPFAEWGASAVLSGFYHVYERLEVDGIPYFIVGTGGSTVSGFGEVDPHSRLRFNGDYGAMLVLVEESKVVFRYYRRNGRLVDEFEVQSGEPGP